MPKRTNLKWITGQSVKHKSYQRNFKNTLITQGQAKFTEFQKYNLEKKKTDLFRLIEIKGQTPEESNAMDQWDFQKVESAGPMFVEMGLSP